MPMIYDVLLASSLNILLSAKYLTPMAILPHQVLPENTAAF